MPEGKFTKEEALLCGTLLGEIKGQANADAAVYVEAIVERVAAFVAAAHLHAPTEEACTRVENIPHEAPETEPEREDPPQQNLGGTAFVRASSRPSKA